MARYDDGVDASSAQEDLGLRAGRVHDMQTTGSDPLGKLLEEGREGGGGEVALEHARPPSQPQSRKAGDPAQKASAGKDPTLSRPAQRKASLSRMPSHLTRWAPTSRRETGVSTDSSPAKGTRRIDRVLAEDYLSGLRSVDIAELR